MAFQILAKVFITEEKNMMPIIAERCAIINLKIIK